MSHFSLNIYKIKDYLPLIFQ